MELAIGQLIKIIIGILVVAAVVFGVYLFGGQINDFFKNVLPSNETSKIVLSLIKK